MGPRRTNLALLVVLVAALATGGLAFAAGTGWGRPVVVAHVLAGLAVLVLAPWKSPIVRRGLARRAGPGRWASVAFGVLVLVAVAAGIAHATGTLVRLGPVSAMQVHVGTALAAVPLLVWHTVARGGARARRTDLTRRALLRAGAVAAAAGLALLAVEGATRLAAPPGARHRLRGRPGPDPGHPVAGRPGPGPRPGRLAPAGPRRGRDPRLDPRGAGRLRRPGRGGPGLHRRVVRPGHLGGRPARPPAPGRQPGACRDQGQPGRHLGHRLPAPPPPGRRPHPVCGHPPRRPPPQRRPRLPGPPGRPRPPRLLVGQMGHRDRGRPRPLVAPAAVPAQLIERAGNLPAG